MTRRARPSLAVCLFLLCAAPAGAQDTPAKETNGRYDPRTGFQLVKSDQGAVNFRLFTYLRYLNSQGLDSTYTDSFGDEKPVTPRQDIHMNKLNIMFAGWVMDPNFRFLVYTWASGTSSGQSTATVVAGNLNYRFGSHLTLSGGVGALPGTRSLEGNFPYWLTFDNRVIAEEFFRPSYTMGVWAAGEVTPGLEYHVMLGNNLSQYGIDAGQIDDRLSTLSASLRWYPTTGEFGNRAAFGDYESHSNVATRLGGHYTRSDETSQGQPNTDLFENVQIRLSDGNVIFQPGLFGPGIQIREVTYQMLAGDFGVKYRGLSLDGEYYWRRIDDLAGRGIEALGFDALEDHGFKLLASGMVVPKKLQLFAGGSQVFGDYGDPWDLRLGSQWYPWDHEVMWFNLEYIHTDKSPVGASSLPYVVGGTGDIVHLNFIVNF